MSQALYPPARPLSVGEVLDLAFLVFKATLVKCLPYGVFAMIAGQLPNIDDLIGSGARRPAGDHDALWMALYIVGILLMLIAWCALLLRQRAIVEHRPTADAFDFGETRRRLLPFMTISLLVLVAVRGEFALLEVVPVQYRTRVAIPLLALSLYLGVILSCTWPAVLFAGQGALGAVRYSARLVFRNWWRAATVYAVGFAVVIAFGVVIAMIIPIIVPAIGVDIAVMTAVLQVVLSALGALAAPFFGALLLAVFGDLRVRTEGLDLQQRSVGMAVE
jgi:hypothetical protein